MLNSKLCDIMFILNVYHLFTYPDKLRTRLSTSLIKGKPRKMNCTYNTVKPIIILTSPTTTHKDTALPLLPYCLLSLVLRHFCWFVVKFNSNTTTQLHNTETASRYGAFPTPAWLKFIWLGVSARKVPLSQSFENEFLMDYTLRILIQNFTDSASALPTEEATNKAPLILSPQHDGDTPGRL